MKRMLAMVTVIAVLLISLVLPVAGEHYVWDCPVCGRTGNTGNYCGMCAYPAPWISGEEQQDNSSNASDVLEKIDMSSVKAGDIIKFGHYEQDNSQDNGLEEIEWMVLDVQDGKALLLSKYGLDVKPYNEERTSITWEKCTLRMWLNGDYMDTAFSEKEKTAILIKEVDNSSSQGNNNWRTNGGDNTQDKVFLLSYAEANRYLHVTYENHDNLKSRVAPTAYAKAKGAFTSSSRTEDGSASGWWWLRSPGDYLGIAAYVNNDGSRNNGNVNYGFAVVRPALWLSLETEVYEEQKGYFSNVDDGSEKKDMSSVKVDDIITFGHYEQDSNLGNGQEEIEWMVLDIQDGKALLLSKYGLDVKQYNTKTIGITWEKCTLRNWLNSDFLNAAFSEKERAAILTTDVDNSANQGYSKWNTDGGNNTQDQIFLLSYADANRYLDVTYNNRNNPKSGASPTANAKAQGAYTGSSWGSASGWWWLRSPGISQLCAAYVNLVGSLSSCYVDCVYAIVRPALWLNLESGIF